jgi:hypothetical protein
MPRKRHWFHVSHDINSDGEVWELTDKFGVSGLRVWLELLSIADRNEGRLPIDSEASIRQLSIKCNTTQRHLRGILEFIQSCLWIVSDPSPRVRNWAIYNPSWDSKKSSTLNRPILTKPNLTNLGKKKSAKAPFVLPDWIDSKVWEAYETMRKDIGHPLKDSSRTRLINGLAKLKAAGNDVDACLDRSTMNGWRGVFPEPSHNGRVSRIDEARARTQAILKRGLE